MNDSTSTTSPGWPTHWPPDSFSGVWGRLLLLLAAALVVVAFFLQFAAPAPHRIDARLIDASIIVNFAFEAAIVGGVLTVLPRLSRFSLHQLGFAWPTGTAVGTAVLGALAMAIVSDGSSTLIERLAHTTHQQESIAIFKALHGRADIALFAFFAVIAAPIAEEVIFRGFFFNAGSRYGGFWLGAISSSVLFGLAHGDVFAIVPLALGGGILCAVYYLSRNIVAAMISHSLFNALTIAALLVAPKLVSP